MENKEELSNVVKRTIRVKMDFLAPSVSLLIWKGPLSTLTGYLRSFLRLSVSQSVCLFVCLSVCLQNYVLFESEIRVEEKAYVSNHTNINGQKCKIVFPPIFSLICILTSHKAMSWQDTESNYIQHKATISCEYVSKPWNLDLIYIYIYNM